MVDDGSEDDTASFVTALAGADTRIRLVAESGQGVSAARNRGIEEASFESLLFLDADDLILPTHLERLTSVLDRDPRLAAAHCGWARLAPDGSWIGEVEATEASDLFPDLARRCVFPVHACLVRRSPLHETGGFDPSLTTCEDWDLWQRIARTGASFASVPEVLALYRLRPGSAVVTSRSLLRDGLRLIDQGHASDQRVPNPAAAHRAGSPPAGRIETTPPVPRVGSRGRPGRGA